MSTLRHPRLLLLWFEFAVLCIAVPLLFVYALPTRWLFGVLWVLALYGYWVLRRYHNARIRTLWNSAAFTWGNLKPILARFVLSAVIIAAAVYHFEPSRFLSFPAERPKIWALVMLFYPLLSVIPQELVFRPFFFARYAPLFPRPWLMLSASAITFGFAHILFQNWISVLLCMAGGLMFALTYQRTRSLAVVWCEHAIYGCFIFTIGLGYYFFHGSVQAVQTAAGS